MATSQTAQPSSPMPYDDSHICKYISLIKEHILSPLESGEVAKHCFATAMTAFSAIDGLGKLLHPDPDAGVAVRFKWFLQRLGRNYHDRRDPLWDLRNSLDHSGINAFCFMSQTADAESEHLEYWDGHLFVHTRQLTRDLRKAVDSIENELRSDATLLKRADSRLTEDYIVPPGWRHPNVCSTAPADVWFLKHTRDHAPPR